MEYRPLGSSGLRVAILGFGAAPLGDMFGHVDPAECTRAVHCALDHGINFFDTAPYYGKGLSEERLGDALQGRRQQAILATKCGRYDLDGFDFSPARVFKSVDDSLRRLKTDYLDLFQAHDIEFGSLRQIVNETLPAMRSVQQQGKVRFIGVTGYQLRALRYVAEREPVDTLLSYCRANLLSSDMDDLLTPFAREQGIGLINASPLHMGVLSDTGPQPWHPAPEAVKRAGRELAEFCRSRGANLASIGLQHCLAHPYVSTTLSGMATVELVERNLRAALSQPDRALLSEIRERAGAGANLTWPVGRPENEDYAEQDPHRRAPSLLEVRS